MARLLWGAGKSIVPYLSPPPRIGTSSSARYCYSVWLRHLTLTQAHGLLGQGVPRTVAEIGPGDSVGVGLAALLSGAERYVALEPVKHALAPRNLQIFDELAQLFEGREAIPGNDEFPRLAPALDSHAFPSEILSHHSPQWSRSPRRQRAIRDALRGADLSGGEEVVIQCVDAWDQARNIQPGTVDMILSQAAMEYPEDLEFSYGAMHAWLKPGGLMSHQLNLGCHGTANVWNGHWTYSDLTWTLLRGRRAYFINRHPLSRHLEAQARAGFEIKGLITRVDPSGVKRGELAPRFQDLTDQDLVTHSACILSTRS